MQLRCVMICSDLVTRSSKLDSSALTSAWGGDSDVAHRNLRTAFASLPRRNGCCLGVFHVAAISTYRRHPSTKAETGEPTQANRGGSRSGWSGRWCRSEGERSGYGEEGRNSRCTARRNEHTGAGGGSGTFFTMMGAGAGQ